MKKAKRILFKQLFKRGENCLRVLCVLSVVGCASALPLNALDHLPDVAWEEPFDSERATVSLSDGQTSP